MKLLYLRAHPATEAVSYLPEMLHSAGGTKFPVNLATLDAWVDCGGPSVRWVVLKDQIPALREGKMLFRRALGKTYVVVADTHSLEKRRG